MNKKRYEKPLLKEHGDLKNLTGGNGSFNDDGDDSGAHWLS